MIVVFFSSCSRTELEWETYTSVDGGFTVQIPKNSKRVDKVEMTPFGKQTNHYIIWKPDGLQIYKIKLFQVSYTTCSNISDSFSFYGMLDRSINMRVKDFTDLEIDTHPINFNGYPGRAFIYDVSDNSTIAVVKQCIVNNKRYDLAVVLKRNYETNYEVHRFYNSFQVLR